MTHEKSTEDGRIRILLAEDDDELRGVLANSLRRVGYEVTECRDGLELVGQLRSFNTPADPDDFHLIISDVRMPGVLGLTVLEGLSQLEHAPQVLLITAFGDEETHAEAERLGAVAMIDKPFELETLLDKVREAVGPGD
jgi:two-component system response regulator (stage 0 sporulation protein F)